LGDVVVVVFLAIFTGPPTHPALEGIGEHKSVGVPHSRSDGLDLVVCFGEQLGGFLHPERRWCTQRL